MNLQELRKLRETGEWPANSPVNEYDTLMKLLAVAEAAKGLVWAWNAYRGPLDSNPASILDPAWRPLAAISLVEALEALEKT